jgi:hypothetical protein
MAELPGTSLSAFLCHVTLRPAAPSYEQRGWLSFRPAQASHRGVLSEFGLTGVTAAESAGQMPPLVPFEVLGPQQLQRVIDELLTNLIQLPPDGQLVGLERQIRARRRSP